MESERATTMLDDFKYSIGRLVVYRHPDPKLPRQSYGHYGPEKTVGEVVDVDVVPTPEPHWVYMLQNVRNQEIVRVREDSIEFALATGIRRKRARRNPGERRAEDGALAEAIAKALSNPERENLLRYTLKELLRKEEQAARAVREGPNLPVQIGDYVRLRGDLRAETRHVHNHYAKIVDVQPSDVAGIENAESKPGQPRMFRTLVKYSVVTSEGTEAEVYDAEIKLFYTAYGRKTILNWRAATLLAEAFKDAPPYKLEYEYLADHVFTREELIDKNRSELAQTLASLLYVKGKLGWRDYQRRNQFFAGTPKSHMLDTILQMSRFDSRHNRPMTREEITRSRQTGYKLRRLLKA